MGSRSVSYTLTAIVFIVIQIFCASAWSIDFVIENNQFNSWENSRINKFFNEANQRLPSSMKRLLQGPVVIEFSDEISDKPNYSALAMECVWDDKATSIDVSSKRTLGDTSFTTYKGKKALLIRLHKLLLNEILAGPEGATAYRCGHKSSYRLALATLLHEVTHGYDFQTKISSERRFKHLLSFTVNFLKITSQKNNSAFRSPDPYEWTSPAEGFAVNMEFFLLDPQFRCRRPALYSYYSESLNHIPFSQTKCNVNYTVKVNELGFSKFQVLDPKNLYRVDYLLADKGTEVSSRFGHSMLRLIFCPENQVDKERCIYKYKDHVIVSFRANLFDQKDATDNSDSKSDFDRYIKDPLTQAYSHAKYTLKGIFGGYPSQMFLMRMSFIIAEYNHFDYRDLVSTELRLSSEEKRDLIHRILEIHSGYRGSYAFFSNNCKTETEDLLKAVVRNDNIDKLASFSPVEMRRELLKKGIAKSIGELTYKSLHHGAFVEGENLKKQLGYNHSAANSHALAKFISFANFLKKESLEKYATDFSADERRQFILEVYNNLTLEVSVEILRHLLFFEVAAAQFNRFEFFKKIYYAEKKENELATRAGSSELGKELFSGYGIYLASDQLPLSAELRFLTDPTFSDFVRKVVDNRINEEASSAATELDTTLNNVKLIVGLISRFEKL